MAGPPIQRRHFQALLGAAALAGWPGARAAGEMALFDAHIHYSHDAWDLVPPQQAVAMRQAGLRGALVSSSNDQGAQMLAAEAPGLIVPSLRPYRTRGEIGTWVRDDSACGDDLPTAWRQTIRQDGLQLVFAPRPAPLPLGRHFALDTVVCPTAGQPAPGLLAVDAEMPTHRHGMNYKPALRMLG